MCILLFVYNGENVQISVCRSDLRIRRGRRPRRPVRKYVDFPYHSGEFARSRATGRPGGRPLRFDIRQNDKHQFETQQWVEESI